MLKKLLSFSLMALLFHVAGVAQFVVVAQASQDQSRVEKIKKKMLPNAVRARKRA